MATATHTFSENQGVLTINGGSSSIKFALYQAGTALERRLYGSMDWLGRPGAILSFEDPTTNPPTRGSLAVPDQPAAASILIDWLEKQVGFDAIGAVGHRVVHGMHRTEPAPVTAELLSSDVRDLLTKEGADVRAAEAVTLFCYQAKKWIGAFAAALGGIDTLVFAGGIGENAPPMREWICEGLGFLGVELDAHCNAQNAPVISPAAAHVKVRVIRTNEELMIARAVARVLKLGSIPQSSPA